MRILFMGTPDIAAESLAALLDAGHEVCGVFTRRDKPDGPQADPDRRRRSSSWQWSTVIPVYQPPHAAGRGRPMIYICKSWQPDLIAVVAYG